VERCGYVGKITILFSFIAMVAIFNKKRSLSDLSPLFWIIISLIASIAVFNVAPLSRLIYELPFFNNNPSNRLLVILGLSFAILGAYGMNILLKTTNLNVESKKNRDLLKSLVIIFFIIIIGIHTFDMASVGKSQNAVVPSEAFYPNTPTIEYVQNHILPGHSRGTCHTSLEFTNISYV
jgi:H+/Cl- antiporter ClcA